MTVTIPEPVAKASNSIFTRRNINILEQRHIRTDACVVTREREGTIAPTVFSPYVYSDVGAVGDVSRRANLLDCVVKTLLKEESLN